MRSVIGIPRALLPAFALLAIPASSAHETMEPDWCSGKDDEIHVVHRFVFDGREVRRVMDRCGIVDDPNENKWHLVHAAAAQYCASFAPRGQTARPVIVGPESFTSPHHHALYRIADGLSGGCAVCISPRLPDAPGGF
jgi:hypothetical protein